MRNIDKKLIGFLVIIIGIFAGVWFYLQEVPAPPTTNTTTTNSPAQASQKPPVLYSLNGTVKTIAGSTITLTLADGKTLKDFSVPSSVTVVKRVTTKAGLTFATAKLSAVKAGSQVVMYTTTDPGKQAKPEVSRVEIIK